MMRAEGDHVVRKITAAVLLALTGMVGACQDNGNQAEENASSNAAETKGDALTAAMGKAADLSISTRLIASAQLGPALDGKGSYTVFAPVDAAWSKLDAAELRSLESAESRPQLIAVLRQHIAPGYVLAADLDQAFARKKGTVTLATMGARPITLHRDGQSIVLGEGEGTPRIVGAPITAGNDVIYRIDRLIPPPD